MIQQMNDNAIVFIFFHLSDCHQQTQIHRIKMEAADNKKALHPIY